jgi:hypothetical protein
MCGPTKIFSMSSESHPLGKEPIVIALCCFAILASLVAGVGFPAGLVLCYVVQTLPLWIGIVFGLRRARLAAWIGLPLFLFWLTLMVFIWLYVLGIASIISGHFSPFEIAMTIMVGAASVTGIVIFTRTKSSLPPAMVVTTFVVTAVVQYACFRISFFPAIAHR